MGTLTPFMVSLLVYSWVYCMELTFFVSGPEEYIDQTTLTQHPFLEIFLRAEAPVKIFCGGVAWPSTAWTPRQRIHVTGAEALKKYPKMLCGNML